MRRSFLIAMPLLLFLASCHSAMVDTTVHNGTPNDLVVLEVEYPSASFGVQRLAPGADFRYRFKILGSGDLKLTYTGRDEKEHKSTGPELHEGQEGKLTIAVTPSGVTWSPALHS